MNIKARTFSFLPKSLFGRLILILASGLILTLLLSMFINYEERDRILSRAGGKETAHRIADTVQLLENLNQVEQERVISVLGVAPQYVELRSTPITINEPVKPSVELEIFTEILSNALGNDRPMHIYITPLQNTRTTAVPPTRPYRHGMRSGHQNSNWNNEHSNYRDERRGSHRGRGNGMGRRMYEQSTSSASYLVQIQLKDGQWVIFDSDIPKTIHNLPSRWLLTLLVLLCAILLLSYISVRWVTRPLLRLSEAADALGRDINQPPLSEQGPTEIKRAARAFNTMQKRLQNFIQDRTHIFAAMSHDLKTPITRLRLRTEMLDDERLQASFEKDLKEMEAMVIETLDFMRGLDCNAKTQPINIMALLESLQDDYLEMGKEVQLTGQTQAPLMGLEPMLKRCFGNLIDNAIFYGKRAYINIEDSAYFLTVCIRDDGTGIPVEQQEKAFEPFYRLEQSRNRGTGGTGLGLTIARNIVHAHGGEITLCNAPQGGLEVSMMFPRQQISH